jgi:hypothetical protein
MMFTTNSPNAKIWASVVAEKLGIPLDVDVINGVSNTIKGGNYAQGGSRVSNPIGVSNNPAIGITTIPVTEQIVTTWSLCGQARTMDLSSLPRLQLVPLRPKWPWQKCQPQPPSCSPRLTA